LIGKIEWITRTVSGHHVYMNTRKHKPMTTTTLTVRVSVDLAARLEEEARRQRLETGDNIGRADLIRAALNDYLDKPDTQ
jgi:hypothetical protein